MSISQKDGYDSGLEENTDKGSLMVLGRHLHEDGHLTGFAEDAVEDYNSKDLAENYVVESDEVYEQLLKGMQKLDTDREFSITSDRDDDMAAYGEYELDRLSFRNNGNSNLYNIDRPIEVRPENRAGYVKADSFSVEF